MSGSLKIKRIVFKAGSNPVMAPLELNPNNIILLVGPNNSGKSLALREIENWCIGSDFPTKVVGTIELDFPATYSEAYALLQPFTIPTPAGQSHSPQYLWAHMLKYSSGHSATQQININSLTHSLANLNYDEYTRRNISAFYTIRLDGRTRFSLAEAKPSGNLQDIAQNHLWKLFQDDSARQQVRKLSEEAFGLYFVIDPTGMTQFKIRMSERAPADSTEEQALDARARTFHNAAPEISDLSDGVQAFIGLTSALLSLPHKIILIDEPEAFLHPPLSRRLGANIARLSNTRNASLVVSTHSADFVMGCLETNAGTQVVRLTYENGVATARALLEPDLQIMTRNPLLRSTGILRALFHRAVIVAEADSDRAFYDEINNRLLQNSRGVKDCLFLNAQNKQTIQKIVEPLRRVGIPAVAIVDLDLIKDTRDLTKLMVACKIPVLNQTSLKSEQNWLKTKLGRLSLQSTDKFKKGGLSNLSEVDLPRAKLFLESLAKYGIFLVPNGEVESWLMAIGLPPAMHGSEWLIEMFTRIGQTETDTNYLHPGPNDVWEFIDQISIWIQDPARLGI